MMWFCRTTQNNPVQCTVPKTQLRQKSQIYTSNRSISDQFQINIRSISVPYQINSRSVAPMPELNDCKSNGQCTLRQKWSHRREFKNRQTWPTLCLLRKKHFTAPRALAPILPIWPTNFGLILSERAWHHAVHLFYSHSQSYTRAARSRATSDPRQIQLNYEKTDSRESILPRNKTQGGKYG